MLLGLGILAGVETKAQTAPNYWGGPSPRLTSAYGHGTPAAAGFESPVIGSDSVRQQPIPTPLATNTESRPLIITGTVYKANGVPLSGVRVDLSGEWDKRFSATTDAQGNFRFIVERDSLGEMADVSVRRFLTGISRYSIGQFSFLDLYRYASADIDFASNRPYELRLGPVKRRRIYRCVKFR
ncbi:hypothetical protein [Hymenobacter agri]